MTKLRKSKTAVTVISKIAERTTAGDACLIVIYGEDLGRKYSLGQGQISIGRSARCDVQIDQEAISRQHAKIVAAFGETVISDLGSTNGSYVNDELIDQATLQDGDLVKIGRTIFKYLSGSNIEQSYHEEIYRLTTIDGLTQVHNKRYLMEQLEREISRARRYQRPFALVVFDVDNFAQVNHGFGHLAGDAVLAQLARMVNQSSRRHDIVARIEAEQFAVALPEIDLKAARIFAERVRSMVHRSTFTFEEAAIRVTLSMGVAAMGEETGPSELMSAVNENLSLAKTRGGNCVSG
ncbi:MAG: GGDEF domain-containing protein [Pseudomonadota bacterium]